MEVDNEWVRSLGLAPGFSWWWCVLPLRRNRFESHGNIPRVGSQVGQWAIQRIALGYVRGRTVGVVELR